MKILNVGITIICNAAVLLFFAQCRRDSPSPISANKAPVANANDLVINLPQDSVELDGSRSTDPDGDPMTYKWTYISGPTGSVIREDSKAKTVVANLKEGSYVFRLTVTDVRLAIAAADVIITVKPVPETSPIVITLSPASQMVKIPVGVNPILEASAMSSTSIAAYSWSNESRPIGAAAPTIIAPNSASTTVTGIDNTVVGTYTFKVTVKDANGRISTAIATIVTCNVEPKIIGSFVGYYSGDSRNTFRFNITPDIANTTVDVVIGGYTSYDNNKTTYTYVPGMPGAVDSLKNCSYEIKAPDGSRFVNSFKGVFAADYKTLTIEDFRLGAGSAAFEKFILTKMQ